MPDMDERTIKRLLFILLASIIAIILFKVVLIKTITGLNNAAVEKKQAMAAKPTTPQQAPTATASPETPTISAVDAVTSVDSPASSIQN